MNQFRTTTAFTLTLNTVFTLLVLSGLLASCKKDYPTKKGNPKNTDLPLAGGQSILVINGNVLVSGYYSVKGRLSTKYWINGESAGQSRFTELVGNQLGYRQAVDEKYRTGYTYKDREGKIQTYRFDQGFGAGEGRMFYYKDNLMVRLENDNIGALTTVAFNDDKPTFAGTLGEMSPDITGGISYHPKTAFIWDGRSPLIKLALPVQSTLFWGVSTMYSNSPNEFYVGGLCGIPMYWKNTDPVVLDERFGEVWQITKSGSDIYAVGLVNKINSNSTGHTAAYWKNKVLHELQDNAQASGIFIDGDDVYVTGSVGYVPIDYRPCYWKNGVRVDLPM